MTITKKELINVIKDIKITLMEAIEQENGPIIDTIWMSTNYQTLFDYIDSILERNRNATKRS